MTDLQHRCATLEGELAEAYACIARLEKLLTTATAADTIQFRDIVEDQTDLICIYSSEFLLKYVNPAYSAQFGSRPEELIGKNFLEWIPIEQRERAVAHVRSLIPDKPIAVSEHGALMSDGSIRWVQWTDRAILDADRKIIGYQGVGRDITEQRHLEAALKQSAERYRLLSESMTDALFVVDLSDDANNQGRLLEVNESACRLLGYTREELLCMSIADIDDPNSTVDVRTNFERLKAGELLVIEQTQVTKDGRFIPVEIHARYAELQGAPVIISLVHYIGGRKLVEQNLRLMGSAIQEAKDAIVITDEATDHVPRILFANNAFRALGSHWRVTSAAPDAIFESPETLRNILADKADQGISHGYRTDGSTFSLQWTRAPIKNAKGEITHRVTVLRDISEQEKQNQALERLKKDLEESRDQFVSVLNSIDDLIVSVALPENRVLYMSQTFEQVTGHSAIDFRRNSDYYYYKIAHPDDLALVLSARERVLRTGFAEVEHRIILPDGSIRWLRRRAWVKFDGLNRPVRLDEIASDITNIKEAEENINRQNAIFQQSKDLIALGSLDQNVVYINEAGAALSGFASPEEAIGKPIADFYLNEDIAHIVRTAVPHAIAHGQWNGENRLRTRSGTVIPVDQTIFPIRDEQGNLKYYATIMRDITERKLAEAREKAITQGLQAVLDITDDLIGLQDDSDFYRRAVELLREKLKLERCAIFLVDETRQFLLGTFGTDAQGKTTDERSLRLPISTNPEALVRHDGPWWITSNGQHTEWTGGQIGYLDTGWIVTTQIRIGEDPIGILSNDAAISGAALDIVKQESVALFCSILGNIIKRRRAEQELIDSEERYRSLVESADASISMVNADGQYLYMNTIAATPFGVAPQELAGKTVFDLFGPVQGANILADVQKVLRENQGAVLEPEVIIGGKRCWYRTSIQPVRDGTGKVTSAIINAVDITRVKTAEANLRLSEQRYQMLVENIPNSVVILYDHDLHFVLVDGPEVANAGYATKEEMIGKTIFEVLPPDFVAIIEPVMRSVLEGNPASYELPFGDLHYAYTTVPLRNAQGEVVYGMILGQNVTARHKAETALIESEQRFQLFMDNVPCTVFIQDQDGYLRYCNDQYARGIKAESTAAIVNKRFTDYLDPATSVQAEAENKTVIAERRAIQVYHRDDAVEEPVYWHIIKFPIPRENLPSLIGGFALDITAEQRAEEIQRASDARYRQMFEMHMLPKMILDPETGRIIDANPAAVAFYGYPIEILTTMTMLEINLAPPEVIKKDMQRALQRQAKSCIFKQRLADGTVRDVEIFTGPITMDGRPMLYSIFTDITARQLAEEAIQQANATLERRVNERTAELEGVKNRLEAIVNYSGDGIILVDLKSGIQQGNAAFNEMFRFDGSVYEGWPLHKLVLEAEAGSLNMAIRTVSAKLSKRQLEMKAKRHDGTGFDCEISIAPVSQAEQAVTSVVCIIRDVTERKQSQQAIATERNLLRTLIDAVPDLIYVKDTQGQIILSNIAHASSLGMTDPAQVVGKVEADLFSPESAALFRTEDEEILRSGLPLVGKEEYIVARNTDTGWWASTTKVPLRDLSGTIVGIVGSSYNISAIKSSEEALRRSQAQLRESQQTLKIVLDSIPVRVFWKDQNSVYMGCNRLFADDVGLANTSDIVGKTDADFPLMRSLASESRATDEVVIAGKTPRQEYEQLSVVASGGQMYIQGSKVPFRDSEANIIGVLGAYVDITDRKHAEMALRESEERLRVLFETAPDAVYMFSLDGTFVDANPAMFEITGLSKEEVIGHDLFSMGLLRPTAVDQAIKGLELAALGGSHRTEYDLNRPDGQLRTVEVVTHPITVNERRLQMGIARDITERRQAEKALRESEERYHAIVNAASEGIQVVDRDGLISYINPRMTAMSGFLPEEMIGQKYYEFIHPSFQESAFQRFEERKRGIPGKRDVLGRHKSGDFRWAHVSSAPVFSADGQFQGMISLFTDIAERKHYEEKLELALKQEKELNELKTRFISTASHEFRTPLATILASVETLDAYRHRMDELQINRRLHKIREQVDRLKGIMDDVLVLSRMEAGRTPFTAMDLDLNAFCLDIIDEYEHRPDIQNTVNYSCSPAPLKVHIDPKLMRQIISNLVSNAIKYSPIGHDVQIAIAQEGTNIIICVADSGIGIPPQDLKHLFEPFHRGANVGTISGTGLGLSIVKQSVELHNGTIEVKSTLGTGTTFIVTIPNRSIKTQ